MTYLRRSAVMNNVVDLQTLTLSAMEDLQQAFLKCEQKPVEGRILSAIVSVRMLHDFFTETEFSCSDMDSAKHRCSL
jgi:hypothetical protein